MRGRTNIPPRMGGIVNGVTREYKVVEADGIDIGDYVELVSGVGNATEELYTGSLYYQGFCYRNFQLSPDKFVTFTTEANELCAYILKKVEGVISTTLAKVKMKMELFNSSNNISFDIIELATGKYLLAASDYYKYIGLYMVEYADNAFILTLLEQKEISSSTTGYGTIDKIVAISPNIYYVNATNFSFLFSLSNGNTITLGAIDKTFTGRTIGIVNGYLILSGGDYSNGYNMISILCNSETLAFTIVNTTICEPNNLILRSTSTCIIGNKIVAIYSATVAFIVTVQSNGSFSFSNEQRLQASSNALFTRCYKLLDGTICIVLYTYSKNSSNVLTVYNPLILFAKLNEITDSLIMGPSGAQKLFDYSASIGTSGSIYVSDFAEDANGVYAFLTSWYYMGGSSTATRSIRVTGFCFEVEQMSLVTLDTKMVKKYSTKINGIAKTAGAKGEKIEVYAPE